MRFQANPHKHGLHSCFWSLGHITIEDLVTKCRAAKIWRQVPECAVSWNGFKCTRCLRCLRQCPPMLPTSLEFRTALDSQYAHFWNAHALKCTCCLSHQQQPGCLKHLAQSQNNHMPWTAVFFKWFITFLCMCAPVCLFVCVRKHVGALRGQKWVLNILVLGPLQAVVNHLIWVLETKFQFS